jgi:hypothetical protein
MSTAYLILVLFGFIIYFLPFMIANSRRHHNQGGIFILNLLLGWTAIGWVIALVMACGSKK